jgi:hypothetical protein
MKNSCAFRLSPALLLMFAAVAGCGTHDSAGSDSSDSSGSSTTPTTASPAPAPVSSGLTGYFVSPSGNDAGAGTEADPWATLAHAQDMVAAGDTVYVRGGTFTFTAGTAACKSQTDRISGVALSKSGTEGHPIEYLNYPSEKPIFDFSGMKDDCRIKGFNVTADWLHIKGLEITGVQQNNSYGSWGFYVMGSHNVFEYLDIHHHMGPGFFMQDGAYNLVLNTDSHHNYDPYSSQGDGQNADGFGVHVPAGRPGNVLRGCRAWYNSDDGFDLINAYSSVVIENSWAWLQGYIPDTTTSAPAGNGNGFKAGGYGGDYDANAVPHTVRFSVAFSNKAAGFYANHHPVAISFLNNTAMSNKTQFNMLGVDESGTATGRGYLRNNVAYGTGTMTSNMTGTDSAYDSWDLGLTPISADFQAVSTQGWDAARQDDGSLPVLLLLRPSATGALIDKGIDIGAPYQGQAPDLGAFEYGVDMTTVSSGVHVRDGSSR